MIPREEHAALTWWAWGMAVSRKTREQAIAEAEAEADDFSADLSARVQRELAADPIR